MVVMNCHLCELIILENAIAQTAKRRILALFFILSRYGSCLKNTDIK